MAPPQSRRSSRRIANRRLAQTLYDQMVAEAPTRQVVNPAMPQLAEEMIQLQKHRYYADPERMALVERLYPNAVNPWNIVVRLPHYSCPKCHIFMRTMLDVANHIIEGHGCGFNFACRFCSLYVSSDSFIEHLENIHHRSDARQIAERTSLIQIERLGPPRR